MSKKFRVDMPDKMLEKEALYSFVVRTELHRPVTASRELSLSTMRLLLAVCGLLIRGLLKRLRAWIMTCTCWFLLALKLFFGCVEYIYVQLVYLGELYSISLELRIGLKGVCL